MMVDDQIHSTVVAVEYIGCNIHFHHYHLHSNRVPAMHSVYHYFHNDRLHVDACDNQAFVALLCLHHDNSNSVEDPSVGTVEL